MSRFYPALEHLQFLLRFRYAFLTSGFQERSRNFRALSRSLASEEEAAGVANSSKRVSAC